MQSASTWLELLLARPLRGKALEDVDEQLVEALGTSELHALVRGVDIGERRAHGDGVQAVQGLSKQAALKASVNGLDAQLGAKSSR